MKSVQTQPRTLNELLREIKLWNGHVTFLHEMAMLFPCMQLYTFETGGNWIFWRDSLVRMLLVWYTCRSGSSRCTDVVLAEACLQDVRRTIFNYSCINYSQLPWESSNHSKSGHKGAVGYKLDRLSGPSIANHKWMERWQFLMIIVIQLARDF